jgi:hypothetical protein
VSATGQFLQVYPPLANGGFNTGALTNLNLQTAQSAPHATTDRHGDPEPAGERHAADRGAVQSDQLDDLQPVDVDHGLRLARQFLSGDILLHADRDANVWDVNMTVNGTVRSNADHDDADVLAHGRSRRRRR